MPTVPPIKKNDEVYVLRGKDPGKSGRVLIVKPKDQKVVVEGIQMIRKHTRPNPQKNIQGGIIEKEAILISIIGLIVGFAVSAVAGYLIHEAYGLVFEYSWQWALTAAAIGLVGGILGALYPAIRASNLDPVNALAYE